MSIRTASAISILGLALALTACGPSEEDPDKGTGGSGGAVVPVCGNQVVEPGEACDDGNEVETDECTNRCKAAKCGDGLIQEDRDVDSQQAAGAS